MLYQVSDIREEGKGSHCLHCFRGEGNFPDDVEPWNDVIVMELEERHGRKLKKIKKERMLHSIF